MRRSDYFLLAAAGLISALIVASFQHSPGYMDADYYYAGGLRLAEGFGFSEQILWNYLDDPAGLPHPSHAYWMPLTSLVAALGMVVLQQTNFFAARLGFLLIAALIPPITAAVAGKFTRQRASCLLAGALAVLPVFYLPYLPTSDSFGICMLFGGLFFFLLPTTARSDEAITVFTPGLAFGLGLLSGLLHLTRAEGFVWLLAGLLAILIWSHDNRSYSDPGKVIKLCSFCVLGYLLIMGPWFIRNFSVFGTMLSPASDRTIWIREYNELFSFPASQISMSGWLATGWAQILQDRIWAAGLNLQTAVAVQGTILMFPFILVGMWHLRKHIQIRIAAITWFMLFSLMTLVFPFQGARGGLFHAGAALQPLLWSAAALGFDRVIQWGAYRRGWDLTRSARVFAAGIIVMVLLMSAVVTYKRLNSSPNGQNAWDAPNNRYSEVDRYLKTNLGAADEVVMVNNAPGYFIASGRSAISIPHSDLQGICSAAVRYKAKYLLLEIDQILGETGFYDHPSDRGCLLYLGTIHDTRIFEIIEQ